MSELILCIETATPVCSIAIVEQGKIISLVEKHEANIHGTAIIPFIDQALAEASIKLSQLSAIAISMGPGSYTGLRIGTSTAKGLCYSVDLPLIAINTLEALATGYSQKNPDAEVIIPMIDARRMEVFSLVWHHKQGIIRNTAADILTSDFYQELEEKYKSITLIGDGAEKTRELFTDRSSINIPAPFYCSAAHMATLANKKFANKEFENISSFEPYYLKEFVAGPAKKAH